ncbi:MAG TPA: OmpH family outer membrane protein [bacterium]|nr:OmpH family outer membrane protein [bacterium]
MIGSLRQCFSKPLSCQWFAADTDSERGLDDWGYSHYLSRWCAKQVGALGVVRKESNSVFRKVFFVLIALCLLGVSYSQAQGQPFKWGVVDIDRILDEYKFVAQAFKKLEQDYTREQSVLDARADEINRIDKEMRLKDELTADESSDTKKGKEEKLKAETLEYFRRGREMSEKLERKKSFHIRKILEVVGATIEDFGKKEGYQAIFKRNFLAYVEENSPNDVTDKIIALLNAAPVPDLAKIEQEFEDFSKAEAAREATGSKTDTSGIEQSPTSGRTAP